MPKQSTQETQEPTSPAVKVPDGLTQESLDKALALLDHEQKLESFWGRLVQQGVQSAADVQCFTEEYGDGKNKKHSSGWIKDGLDVAGTKGGNLPWITNAQIGEMLAWAALNPMDALDRAGKLHKAFHSLYRSGGRRQSTRNLL